MSSVRIGAGALAMVCATIPVRPAAAQQTAAAPASGASAPAAAASAPARAPASAAGAASAAAQRVEITGGRDTDTEARRRSTAAKIVIGREEIDKFGDATVGEVLRRLPGVTTPGAPGRGGPPRLRGLGSGYTQLLIDGQRLPPGFSLDALTPEQIERIEILRAPTAETGARAIAGTINIITRDGFKRRLNELRIGTGYENGAFSPGVNWTRNDSVGEFIYNTSLAVFRPHRITDSEGETLLTRRDDGTPLEETRSTLNAVEKRTGVALTSRLQWRLGEGGDNLVLMPNLFHNEGGTDRLFTRTQTPPPAPGEPSYDNGTSDTTNRFTSLRLNSQWRQRLNPAVRMELGANAGLWRSAFGTLRNEFLAGVPGRTTDDYGNTRERSLNLTAKFSGVAVRGAGEGAPAGGGAAAAVTAPAGRVPAPPAEHNLVGGFELETIQRREQRIYTDGGVEQAAEFGDTFDAATLRLAAYLQDEWNLNANWAFHAGLRWEGIATRGDAGEAAAAAGAEAHPTNRSSVVTPLMHLLWKPDPAKRDQVRLSLTRSYRAPSTQNLIARPSISASKPARGPDAETNDPTQPDSVGNPNLKPELARGLDLAFERYLEGGGVLSANVFYRRITNLMRRVTSAEAEVVSWADVPRYVAREQNIGDAVTMGLELEAKYRLDQLFSEAPRVEMRHNLGLFRSRVDSVIGPDNRLDQQAHLTANLGADYRVRSVPLTLGGNLNIVPGYRTQLADERAVTVSSKAVLDFYALWTFNPAVGLRLLASNLAPRDYATRTEFDFALPVTSLPVRETAISRGPSYTNWQLRLELKL